MIEAKYNGVPGSLAPPGRSQTLRLKLPVSSPVGASFMRPTRNWPAFRSMVASTIPRVGPLVLVSGQYAETTIRTSVRLGIDVELCTVTHGTLGAGCGSASLEPGRSGLAVCAKSAVLVPSGAYTVQ